MPGKPKRDRLTDLLVIVAILLIVTATAVPNLLRAAVADRIRKTPATGFAEPQASVELNLRKWPLPT
jgi:hypothetical protein